MHMGGKIQTYDYKWSLIWFPWATIFTYFSLFGIGNFNWKLGTLQWNWQIVFGFEYLFLVKYECTTTCSIIGYLLVL